MYQQDGCGLLCAKRMGLFLIINVLDVLPWPAQSPDLTPTKNVRAIMKRRLREQRKYPTNLDALFLFLC